MTTYTYGPVRPETKGILQTGINLAQLGENLLDWLRGQSSGLEWLLAHTFGGVVWGHNDAGQWYLSSGLIPSSPTLETSSLLQLRAFGKQSELFLWREDKMLSARRVDEANVPGLRESEDYYDERQILWGTQGRSLTNGFTEVTDGAQGLAHAVPLPFAELQFGPSGNEYRPLRLHVRHYLGRHEDTGLAGIWLSRLLRLTVEEPKNIQRERD